MNCAICGNSSDWHPIDTLTIEAELKNNDIAFSKMTWEICRVCTSKVMKQIGDDMKRYQDRRKVRSI